MIFLSKKLKQFRENSGYSQKQMAEFIGCERSTYTYYETGRTRPDIIVLGKLCKILGITCEQLISEDDGSLLLCDSIPYGEAENKIDEMKIYELSNKEKELVAYFRLLNEKDKLALLDKLNKEK